VNARSSTSLVTGLERAAIMYNPHNRADSLHPPLSHDPSQMNSYIKIETKPIPWTCAKTCPCQCHVPTRLTTPQWLRGLFGVAFANSTGISLLSHRSCDIRTCAMSSHGSGSLRFSYLFPTWLLRIGIDFTASWCSLRGVCGTWTLKMPRTIDDSRIYNKICYAMEHCSVIEVRRMMELHKVRAFDSFSVWSMQTLFEVGCG
jgi:hypothetical protein